VERRALRRWIALELGLLAGLTLAFLSLVPERPLALNLALALLALLLLLANGRFTRERVWARFPADGEPSGRGRSAWASSALITGLVLALFLAAGLLLGYREGGWSEAGRRVLNPQMLLALLLYLPWALLQQALFQLYLLGRLLVLIGAPGAVLLTGLAYSLVHLPHAAVTAATALAGVVWTGIYYRDRRLLPIAVSHALLGAAFFYWVLGLDLLALWAEV
jgi:membrane protease YdiL (CAAX protease family)